MAFFNELIENIERTPERVPLAPGPASTVAMYAPRRMRDRPEAQQKAEAERAYWRDRAFQAEDRLKELEARIRRIAAAVPHN